MTNKAIPEAVILAPRSRSLDNDSDSWQEFELKDVKVFLPDDSATLTNLLEANLHHPVQLTGHLEPVAKEQTKLLLQSTSQRAPLIGLNDVRLFCYGQYEDGNIGLWAGGMAGWYALKPARAYRAIWEEMVDAVKMLYWVADVYRESDRRKEKANKSDRKNAAAAPEVTATVLFKKYAKDASLSTEQGKQEIYRHKDFLLSSMLAGKESINWEKNPLYIHLCERFPEDYTLVKARFNGSAASRSRSARSPPLQQARETRQNSISSETSSLKRKRGRTADESGKSTIAEVVTRGDSKKNPGKKSDVRQAKPAASTSRGTRGSPTETGESEVGTPHVAVSEDEPGRYAMKGRSALRPKATKANKGVKAGKALLPDEDEDGEDEPASSPTAIRLAQPISKGGRARKRRHSKQDVDEGIDIPSSPATTPSDTAAGAEDGSEPDSELALRLKHVPDPVQEDTWVCALDGCSHKVYQASLPDSQRLIREHYALHAYDDDDRVQLVKKLQHPSLPVNHLMERVRLQARVEGFPASMSAPDGANAHSRFLPLPVVRY